MEDIKEMLILQKILGWKSMTVFYFGGVTGVSPVGWGSVSHRNAVRRLERRAGLRPTYFLYFTESLPYRPR